MDISLLTHTHTHTFDHICIQATCTNTHKQHIPHIHSQVKPRYTSVTQTHTCLLCLTDDLTLCVTELQCLPLWGVIVSRMTCYDGEEHTNTHMSTHPIMCVLLSLPLSFPSYWLTKRKKATGGIECRFPLKIENKLENAIDQKLKYEKCTLY